MCRKFMLFVAVFVFLALAGSASALVVSDTQTWNEEIQLNTIGGLEITGTGQAIFNARVNQDAVDVTIAAGGILETNDTYKLPDDHPEPTTSNVYVNGTWNANNIESKYNTRAATIYVGATGVINIQIGYGGTAPYENPADYDPQTWLANEGLKVDPSLGAGWFIQITDMGGGAAQITAESLAPQVRFDSAASGDLESVSPAELIVTLSGAEEGQTYTVDYAAVGGTATAGEDYVIAGGGPACWGSATQCHGDTDDDGEVKGSDFLALKASWYKCDPEPGYDACADFDRDGCVKGSDFLILKSNWYQAVPANCPPEGGSATLEFAPGETSKTISIEIINDGLDEEDETIIVELLNPAGPNVVLGEPNQHVYTIEDPRPEVSFEKDSSSGREDVSPAEITVCLSFASTETVTVDYCVTGGTATGGGVDYTLACGTLTFSPGELCKTISIAVVDDGVDEDNETIVITLSDPANAKMGAITEHTYTIIDPSVMHLKVDLALPMWGTTDPWPGTVKEGWWGFVASRWADMYMHDAVWERGEDAQGGVSPDTDGIDGSGVHVGLDISNGNGGFHNYHLCRCNLGGDCPPSGSVVGDPIANGWFHNIDWGGECTGDIHMRINDLPPGRYRLTSYHNHWEPCSQSTRNCLDCYSNMPPMQHVYATSIPVQGTMVCEYVLGWGTGTGVVSITEAHDIDVTTTTSDSEVATSVIVFETDGSDVLVVYDGGDNVYPDPARSGREGHKAILNAFELELIQ